MPFKTLQRSFTGGEMSPAMYGRMDDQKYQQGLAECRNFICLPQGPVVTRPGTEFVRAAKYADRICRLIPFQFSASQTMVIELGHKYARFHTKGATLLNDNGTPYEIATPYDERHLMDIHYVQSADVITLVHSAYAPRELARYNARDWRLTTINFTAPLAAPTITEITYSKGDSSSTLSGSRYTARYRVTSLYEDASGNTVESEQGAMKSVACNLYIDDSYNTIKWGAVSGAQRYRVYKSYSGVYGLIGETTDTQFIDNNINPDEGVTPSRYDRADWLTTKGISSVTVTNQGSGFRDSGWVSVGKVTQYPRARSTGHGRYGLEGGDENRYPVITAKVIDLAGTGVGATVSISTRNYTVPQEQLISRDDETYDTWNDYYTEVTGITLTNEGTKYTEPYIIWMIDGEEALVFKGTLGITGDTLNYLAKAKQIDTKQLLKQVSYQRDTGADRFVALRTNGSSITLGVSDSTGSGARVVPVVTGGKITSVIVEEPGRNYSNPSVYVLNGNGGSGATFSVAVNQGGDNPAAVSYIEQRRFFAGTPNKPQMVWATRPGTETDLSYTLPAKEDNRLKFRIAANQASKIAHLVAIQQALVFTESSVYRLNDGISATDISVKPQTSEGASMVQPVVVNNIAVYVAARGGHPYEIGYQYQKGGFVAGDLAIRAGHFFESAKPIDLARQVAPDPILWFVMSDGALLGLTYMPDEAIGAWHKHTTKHGWFESAATVTEGEEDVLYVSVRRVINGKTVRYIERLASRQFKDLQDSFCVDCGATYEGKETDTISGLDYLEGETVSIVANGAVLPSETVKNGRITLDEPGTVVRIGLPIEAHVKTLPVALQTKGYGQGDMKNVNKMHIRVYRSAGIWVGPDKDKLIESKPRADEFYGEPPELRSDEVAVTLTPTWQKDGTVVIQQKDPLPLMITGITGEFAR